jgi:hypothetical protein
MNIRSIKWGLFEGGTSMRGKKKEKVNVEVNMIKVLYTHA